ncbi:MAG: S-layer homology domain-containing protein, partial [Firmicutes bacterium]|nr:S-layer homology domain-containing protein [Bacillota bacterium]
MTFHLWNAHLDQASMGDAAFENNRQALVTISDGGKKAKIQIASNPVAVSGYTSALQDITSDDVSINIEKKESFTTNTRYDGTEHTFQRVSLFSFELDDTSTEYVSVRINTPYTPMDNISENEGGFIAARLKLEWGSMNDAGENAKISSDNSVASGSSSSDNSGSSVNKIDDETGIQIKADEYVFPADTEFKTERIESGDDYETAKKLIDINEFRLFTIKAENNEKEVSPDGVADVCFPVEDTDENVKIYRINKETNTQEAGAVELEYKLSADKRYYVITVKEFGLFAIAKTDEEMNVEVDTNDIGADDKTAFAEEKVSFADIEDHPAREYIIKAVAKGLFNGVSETEFAPDKEATRAMFVTVLGRLEGIDENTNKTSKFDDVNN